MASLIAKKEGKQLFYYLVESARGDGQPRIVHQAYLGSAHKVAALVQDRTSPVPLSAAARDFGLPGALWLAAQQTTGTAEPSCILSGTFRRNASPHKPAGDALEKILPEHLDPLATGDDDPLNRAQLAVLDLWKQKQRVSRRLLAYDTTNFYTFIASNNTRRTGPAWTPQTGPSQSASRWASAMFWTGKTA